MAFWKVLIVDDEPIIRKFLAEVLKRKNCDLVLAENGQEAIDYLSNDAFDIILTDMKMPLKNGLDVLHKAKELSTPNVVVIMTAHGTVENAVSAMQEGAFTYLLKPFSVETIEAIFDKATEHLRLKKQNEFLKKEIFSSSIIIHSPVMKALWEQVEKIAKSQASVFISGESGTGKEVIAEALHTLSPRKDFSFVRINCAAIPEHLLESELFGYEKGAFTGANCRKEGKFEVAHNGTLLLDEITEIPLALQPKLLRAIQEQECERVGATKPSKVNIRFLATSNRNMKETIQKNLFREDLYFRLNVIPLHIPPLRERREDILPLAYHFLKKFCLENHKPLKTISKEAEEKLLRYSFPGNVRELANIMERSCVLHQEEILQASHIFFEDFALHYGEKDLSIYVGMKLEEIEKELILATLKRAKNNKVKASSILGITPRTLRNKLKEYFPEENAELF